MIPKWSLPSFVPVSHCLNSLPSFAPVIWSLSSPSMNESFDSVILSFLSDSLGAHLSSWSWLKASLLVSMGGLRLRKAAVHSAAYCASLCCSASILEDVLGSTPILAPFLDACRPLLSHSAARPEWISHQDINVPISQCSRLLLSIKPLSPPCWFWHLVFNLGPWLCLQPSRIPETGSLWYLTTSLGFISLTGSSVCVPSIG